MRSCIVLLVFASLVLLPLAVGQEEVPAGEGGAAAETPEGAGAHANANAETAPDALEEHKKELAALKEKLAAAEERARAAEEDAKAAEAELQQMRQHAAAKEAELEKKTTELETALLEQRQAAQAIKDEAVKDASSQAATLSQAKVELETKIKSLEANLASSSNDSKKVAELEAELETMRKKLSNEKEAQKLVVKLRQEKEELREQLEEAKNNMYHQAQSVWLPQAQESLRNLTEVASTHASKAASTIQEVYSEAETQVMKGLDSLDKDQRMESVREVAKPWLAEAKKSFLKLWDQMKGQVRYPLPELKDGVRSSVAGMGALARYKNEFADAADYWLVICPLLFVWLLVCTTWMNRELRLFCLRVQQSLFLVWFSAALLALLQRTTTLLLFADALSPPQLAAFHMVGALHYAIVCAFYLLCVLFGPNRFAAILQLGGSAWVLLCYYPQLVAPVLADPNAHAELSASFTTPHFFRVLFSLVLAYWGHATVPQRPARQQTLKSGKGGKTSKSRTA